MKRLFLSLLALLLPGFALAESLSADGRIGKIVDFQGVVSIKPAVQQRWTLAEDGFLIQPGDWLRSDVRGANAVAVRTLDGTRLTLGPGTLVEALDKATFKLVSGEMEVVVPQGVKVSLLPPGGQAVPVEGTHVFRAGKEKIETLEKEPNWLQGFKGAVKAESMGSLLAKVEGRNVPLTLGYHRVSVTIRDQIARTVIEESFVNHTDATLEGVFHFPLPPDASISEFGMWIGDELVMADVVEKQRAREIYETILREWRDPALLEWAGGNIFKARVFPILGRSEKRITIAYTQVLPLKGAGFRYSYPLRSEMLRLHPLRELAIDVQVHSALPLKSATCASHETRNDLTRHSAHLEFSAQEYVPDRDFEVEIEVDRGQSPVALIPHRRGEDGYFLLMLNPPEEDGERERAVVPDGEPLELLILADTSGSTGEPERKAQEAFIGALLASLGEKDRFNLAACDVDCQWLAAEALPVTDANLLSAKELLAARDSLGWSDLDRAFGSALERAGPKTQVIYLGDGVITTGDADPVAFSERLKRLHAGKSCACHAVGAGSSFESVVLNAIGSLGGGSVRQIQSQGGPVGAARQLLCEMTQPGLRDLSIEFKGFRTARVYPERLPNLPVGSQQILTGRYLPEGRERAGEVIVSALKDGQRVQFRAKVALPGTAACPVGSVSPASSSSEADDSSFIPRLWARMQLDFLLSQGQSPEVRDEIIALSEEYNILTPYTSFLVLESDADRARFQVKRRFRMRDGERFFAEGRDSANFELAQQQMKRAGTWRSGLRRLALAELANLGRDLPASLIAMPLGGGDMFGGEGGGGAEAGTEQPEASWAGEAGANAEESAGFGGESAEEERVSDSEGEGLETVQGGEGRPDEPTPEPLAVQEVTSSDGPDYVRYPAVTRGAARGPEGAESGAFFLSSRDFYELGASKAACPKDEEVVRYLVLSGVRSPLSVIPGNEELRHWLREIDPAVQWVNQLFPGFEGVSRLEPVKSEWPEAARKLAESLLCRDKLLSLPGGLEVSLRSEDYGSPQNTLRYVRSEVCLVSSRLWLRRSWADTGQILVNWCDGKERGVLSRTFQLGRIRPAGPGELPEFPIFNYHNGALRPLAHSWGGVAPTLEKEGEGRATLRFVDSSEPDKETRYEIDTQRRVVLGYEGRTQGKVSSRQIYGDFVQVGGCWWPQRHESFDEHGKRSELVTHQYRELTPEGLSRRFAEELAPRKHTIFVGDPVMTAPEAKQAILDKSASFESHLVLAAHFGSNQQGDHVWSHWRAARRSVGGKPGVRWIEDAILKLTRRNEELKQRLLDFGSQLARNPREDEAFFLYRLTETARGLLQANEMLLLMDVLKPVADRQSERVMAMLRWREERANYLEQIGHSDKAAEVRKEIASLRPWDCDAQVQYVEGLVSQWDYDAAYEWLDKCLSQKDLWPLYHEVTLRELTTDYLANQRRVPEIVRFVEPYVEGETTSSRLCMRYLAGLIRTEQAQKAYGIAERWIKEGVGQGTLRPGARARLEAAVRLALGEVLGNNRIDERWHDLLAETVRSCAWHPRHVYTANQIMGHWEFAGTDAARALCKEQARLLIDKAAELEFDQIQYLVGWISREDRVTESETWQQIAKALENRWTAEQDRNRKEQIAGVLTQVLSERCGASAYLAFLRRQVGEGPERDRADYRSQLFKALLSQPWSLECEQEAFGLLPELPFDKDWYAPLTQVEALYRLNDWAVRGRHSALMSLVRKKEGLSRTELKAEKAETLRKAREGLAKSLAEQAARQDARLRPWIDVERLSLAVLLKDDPTRIAAECWKSVGAEPPKPEKPLKWLDAVLLARHLRILEYFASRPNADLALIDRLLAWIDKAIALNPDDLAWESHKYRLLVALDRPDDTEKAVRAWIRPGEADTTWRVTLGYLLAERNRVPEAIEQFEAVKPPYELGPQEYRSLADWYMLTNDKEKREEGELLQVVTEQGDKLENRLRQELETWQGRERPPDEVDPKLIRALTALFRGSSPEKHVPLLNQFYSVTRDFRLLECLPEGIIGHTAGQVYPFLQQLRPVLDEIQDEATADSLVRSLAKTRSRAKTPVDQRALDLLLVQVKRRAAEVTNQPGQHVPDALKAMKRSFKGEWSPGERRLMADLLADLGQISQSPLAEEQLRQLAALQRDEPKGTPDRLHVTYCYAKTLGHYSQWDQALGLLQAGLEDLRLASGGTLPKSAQEILGAFVSFLETQKQHGRAEKFLLAEMERPANEAMLKYYRQRLYELYGNALSQSCEVSLGSGATLYEALEQKLLEECRTRDTNYRYALLRQLCGLYRTASEGKIGGAQDDLRQFAWKRLPELVAYHTDDTQSIVETAAGVLHDALGPREGLAFLIARCEKEPTWLRRSENSTWNSHAATMGQWRREAGEIGDLAPRLLELAADALRLDLETHQTRYGSIYCQGTNFFWGEKAEDFAWVAEEVYAKRKNSGSHIARIARYLHDDLRRVERAIEMLFDAYRQELLDDWGKSLLAWYLGEKGRHQEAIPILQKLLDQQPKNLDCRIQLMHAHFRAGRKAETQRLLDATDTYLRTQGDWWQNDVTKFADACLATEQYEKSIVLYKKLVAWRPSVRGRTPADNYSLPSYYTNMARAYAGLGQTADAVEAVARAIVSWGNMHEERQDALETLKKTLRDAKHLDDYVKQLDKQVAETGLENPIVRKAVGQTYLEKGQFEQAIRNLQLAVQVQPNDTETHNALIQAYELQRDPKGAIRQLVALARLSRRNIQCYNDLGYRLTAAGKPAEAERAYTTIVEMQPNESESHSFLALIRQQQDRWDDAIAHWRQVARIRALEPTGLLRLAEAQIHQKRWGEARESLGTLLNRSWPSQFGDVHAEAKRLLQQVEDGQR